MQVYGVIDGFAFESKTGYQKAKAEAEKIEYIKRKTDMSNPIILLKLYNTLAEKKMFVTPIGLSFMAELRHTLLKSESFEKERLDNIFVPAVYEEEKQEAEAEQPAAQSDDENSNKYDEQLSALRRYKSESLEKEKKLKENNIKLRNYRIISIFLILMVILVCAITLLTDNSPFIDAENKVINKYSAWEAELEERENRLNELEKQP